MRCNFKLGWLRRCRVQSTWFTARGGICTDHFFEVSA